ncbi:GNAT family N-acetyltransferase [Ferrimonas lipolytica]|uniref:GNAT family N-acetyltransferase n=1 Tax=Ferrimonas lipolytica TaxID=2724191 RepID=A0A6H1UF74_9GAMM|nr:GNAT family N-acetyltransferase [Ferrimonas lipolytica]QIZ77694.1 GNAT family N-acetyltransferase [Ferrimonas lipolytica]
MTILTLRPLRETDLTTLIELETDAEAMFYTGSPEPKSTQAIEQNLHKLLADFEPLPKFQKLMAVHPEHGSIGIAVMYRGESGEAEIGYMMLRRFWGKGFGHHLAQATFERAQQWFPNEPLTALVYEDNIASTKVLLKLGFVITKRMVCPDRGLKDQKLEWHGLEQ